MNTVQLIGRLTRDPEIKDGANTKIAKFSIAVKRIKPEEADFIPCTAFGKTAEIVEKYVKKGTQVGINGRIQSGSYEKDGKKIYTLDIIVDRLHLLGSKSSNASESTEGQIPEGFSEITAEDIPF